MNEIPGTATEEAAQHGRTGEERYVSIHSIDGQLGVLDVHRVVAVGIHGRLPSHRLERFVRRRGICTHTLFLSFFFKSFVATPSCDMHTQFVTFCWPTSYHDLVCSFTPTSFLESHEIRMIHVPHSARP